MLATGISLSAHEFIPLDVEGPLRMQASRCPGNRGRVLIKFSRFLLFVFRGRVSV